MRKNTLFVTVLVGLGSVAAIYAGMNEDSIAKYTSRNAQISATEANSEFFDEMHKNVNTGKIEPSDFIKASQEISARRKSQASLGLNWEYSGPDNIGGLTRAIVIDKDDSQRLYAGADGGGVFVSTNAGGTWEYRSQDWDNINVSTLVQDGNGKLYAGTGITFNGRAVGGGIYSSDDRGETWAVIPSTIPNSSNGFFFINRMAVSKTKNSSGNYTIYVGTNNGLKVSTDNGSTWTEPMTIPNCVNVLQGQVQDVIVGSNDRVFVSYNGQLYISDDGATICSYVNITDGMSGSSRMTLAVCPNDPQIVYAYQGYNSNGGEFKVFKSTNGGEKWGELSPAPPPASVDSNFNLLGSNPVTYNQALVVDPANCENIYVGAVQLYRVSGAWTSVASQSPFFTSAYVHPDQHFFVYDPKNPNIMYVGNDGGVGKTTTAGASFVQWTTNNRNYATTQYYGVSTSSTGKIMGGSQDNGNHLIDPSLPSISGKDGVDMWTLGDGFDCEASTIGQVAFVTSQYGNVGRDSWGDNPGAGIRIHSGGTPGGGGGQLSPFNTVIRLWESKNDLTSKDSLVFFNDTARSSLGTGNGAKQTYSGTLFWKQPTGAIVPGTLTLNDVGGGQTATDDGAGIIKSFGDSVGFVDYATGAFSVRWSFAPPSGSSVNGNFNVLYSSGDTLKLQSANQNYPFDYVLSSDLVTNDTINIQDPIQSLLAVNMNDGVNISRQALYATASPTWQKVSTITPRAMEYSHDGNHLYIAGGNAVVRISGLNELYPGVVPDSVLTTTTIFSGNFGSFGGLCIHPTDPNKLLITAGGFGSNMHVWELGNAQNATSSGNSMSRLIQGDLPDMPIFDPEYNVNKPEQVLIGTEYGVWATDNVDNASVSWTQEASGVGNVQVLDVLQQRLPFDEASNYGRFYLGTYGRGIWTSGDLVSTRDQFDDFADFNGEINNLKLFPNPVSVNGKVTFDMPVNGSAEITIYDISGRMMLQTTEYFSTGTAEYQFNTAKLNGGTYFMTVRIGSAEKHAKFVVVK